MTQKRAAAFIRPEKDRGAAPSLFERKAFGASYLVHVPTSNHGWFSSYAAMGIAKAVPGYWDASGPDPGPLYEEISRFLLWWGREEEAVGVFELNASLYPGSWRAHDSLGEAYAVRGRTDAAIRSYRKSLELNPQNPDARAALERLSQPVKKVPEEPEGDELSEERL